MKNVSKILALILFVTSSSVLAEGDLYATTNIQISKAYSADNDFITGYGADDGDRIQVRLEHQSEYALGENYFFMDWVNFDSPAGGAYGEGDTGTSEIYALWNGDIRLSKLGQQEVNFGIINDISFAWRFEAGSYFDYTASAFGLGLHLDVPGFSGKDDAVTFNWWRRSNCDDYVTGPYGSPDGSCYDNHNFFGLTARKYWETSNGMRWNHQTILRYQDGTTSDKADPNAAARHDRIFLEIEVFAHIYGNLQLGARYEYFWDEGGIDYDRNTFAPDARDSNSIPMIVLKYDFH